MKIKHKIIIIKICSNVEINIFLLRKLISIYKKKTNSNLYFKKKMKNEEILSEFETIILFKCVNKDFI